jgi:hypothetical protein
VECHLVVFAIIIVFSCLSVWGTIYEILGERNIGFGIAKEFVTEFVGQWKRSYKRMIEKWSKGNLQLKLNCSTCYVQIKNDI